MAERARPDERLRAGAPLRVGTVTLLVIERAVVRSYVGASWAGIYTAMEPYALVVCDPGGVRALNVEGSTVKLDDLRKRVPEMDVLLRIENPHV